MRSDLLSLIERLYLIFHLKWQYHPSLLRVWGWSDLTIFAVCVCAHWITALQPVIFCQAIPWTNTLHPHHFGDSLNTVWQCWCSNSVRRPERKSVPVPASQIFWPVIVGLLHYKNRKSFYLPSSPLWKKSFKLHTSEKQFKLHDFHHWDSWFEIPSVRHFKCTYAATTNTHQLITLHINMEKG